LELHALVQAVVVTDTRSRAVEELSEQLATAPSDVRATPFLCLGTHEEIAHHLVACRARWGISHFTVRDIDAFAPVVALLKGLDATVTPNAEFAP
jgi:hypothetical protein